MEQETFFDFAAEVGLTKHFGGLEGTQELAALCHIDERAYVLDVGCGAGVTALGGLSERPKDLVLKASGV